MTDFDFDPARLAEAAIQANLDPQIFEQIDDREIPRPKNFYEWAHGSLFLDITPFPKQVEICTNYLGQFCPHCTDDRLVERDERWGNVLLCIPTDLPLADVKDRVRFLDDGTCPQCRRTRAALVASGDLNHYLNLNGCAGMRGSKSVTVGGLLATYQLARYLLIPSPSRYFGLMQNQMLHGTFVAITAGQAYDTLWQAFKDRIDGSPWFINYHAFLKEEAKRLGKEELYDIKDTFLWYGHKQLSFSFCGPDIRTIRGRTRFFCAIDEIGWFDAAGETSSARIRLNSRETHHALLKSLRTIRSAATMLRQQGEHDPLDGLNANVSSPSSLNDAIMTGLRDANEDRTIYGFHYATWEMNPHVPLDSLRDEMRNAKEFERDYAAVPPLGANQFIDAEPSVVKCQLDHPQTRMVQWSKEQLIDEFGDTTVYLKVRPSVSEKTRPRVLTVDTGLSNNSFAVTMWSYDRDTAMPVCDVALECSPELRDGVRLPVNFPQMYESVIEPLLKSFRVILCVYDRWNSVDQVQRIRRDHKIEAVQYSLKWQDFLTIRSRVIESTLRLPRFEMSIDQVRRSDERFDDLVRSVPATHLALQILTVREGGRKVMKPLNGTDDLFRCLCLAVKFLLDPKYTRRFSQYGAVNMLARVSVGSVKSNRGVDPTRLASNERRESLGVRKSFVPSLK
jgi:hypothetical protein